MISRFLVTAGLGLLTAFALFWVMQALVIVTGELREGSAPLSVDYVRLRRDTTPELKKREPPRREKPKQAPPPPEMNVAKAMRPGDNVSAIVPMVDTAVELEKATSLGAGGDDRDVVPLVRVEPDYPPRAKARGIEGYVDIRFTITPAGTVADAEVIGANPAMIFDQAALRAVRKWKYQPKIEDGKPVPRPGQEIRLRFEL